MTPIKAIRITFTGEDDDKFCIVITPEDFEHLIDDDTYTFDEYDDPDDAFLDVLEDFAEKLQDVFGEFIGDEPHVDFIFDDDDETEPDPVVVDTPPQADIIDLGKHDHTRRGPREKTDGT